MSTQAPTFTKAGSKAATATKLDDSVFGLEVNSHELLKQAYVTYLANGRLSLAKTKTRGDVSGGGKKPWKQKGTGRARFGSSRVPIWRGGGVALGPTGIENYSRKINIKAKRQATRQALSLAAAEGRIAVIEDFNVSSGKTKDALQLLAKVGVENTRALLVVDNKTPELTRATGNLQNVQLIQASYLNVYDIMNADKLVMTTKALDAVSQWLGAK